MRRHHRFFAVALLQSLLLLNNGLTARGQTVEVLHSFNRTNGANPQAGLLQGNDGNFYGTTLFGGAFGKGTVFQIKTDGSFATLMSFSGTNGNGPRAGLIQASDGNLYGTTSSGGGGGYGTVFRVATNGALTTMVSFNITNGSFPWAELAQAMDGGFYGTTLQGGVSNWGTVFQMATNGLLTTLFSFDLGTNGHQPQGGLVQAGGGYLYGTTSAGGGTVFRITTNGELATLVRFDGSYGSYPETGLVQASDGILYGTTSYGGTNGFSTIFGIMPDGALTRLVSLNSSTGYRPGPLTQMGDGFLYGVTSGGGASGYGTVFRMATNGALTTLVSFNDGNGSPRVPQGRIVQGTDGNLYGTSFRGGAYNGGGTSDSSYGTVFRIILPVVLNARQNGNELVLSWATNAPGLKLQSSKDLSSPTNWIDFTNPPAVFGAQFVATNIISPGSQFYRLKK